MNPIIEQIRALADQYGVSQDKIAEILVDIITRAYNKQIPDQVIDCNINLETGKADAHIHLKVIGDDVKDGDYDDFAEIPLAEANKYGKYNIGDECLKPFDIFSFFKKHEIITIMQVFKQKLLEINNQKVYAQWAPRLGELIMGTVEKKDKTKGFYTIELEDGNIGFLSRSETIPGEELIPGQKYQFYVKDVKEQSKGWPIILSRADSKFVLKLLEIEVPEIASGEIRVELIERIAGFKTKLAVSGDASLNYDPASVVVGNRGSRIKTISDILHGEKIEVIKYSADRKQLLLAACGTNNLVGINYVQGTAEGEQDYATLITTEKLLPVIIGKKGNNIKLISKLVNCSIDINTVEEAEQRDIKYEQINSPESLNAAAASMHGHQRGWSRPSPSSYSKPKVVINNANNDAILESMNNMSQEEIEQKYGINLDVDTTAQNINSQPINYDDFDDEVEEEQLEFENDDLADAFADEIAGLNDDDDNN